MKMHELFRDIIARIEEAESYLEHLQTEFKNQPELLEFYEPAAKKIVRTLKNELRALNDQFGGQHFTHYKDHLYFFRFVSRESEIDPNTGKLAWKVTYENEEGDYWNRPFEMFFEDVEHEGETVPRFAYTESKDIVGETVVYRFKSGSAFDGRVIVGIAVYRHDKSKYESTDMHEVVVLTLNEDKPRLAVFAEPDLEIVCDAEAERYRDLPLVGKKIRYGFQQIAQVVHECRALNSVVVEDEHGTLSVQNKSKNWPFTVVE